MARHLFGAIAALMFATIAPIDANAQARGFLGAVADFFGGDAGSGRELRATIWVDPDGCEHWVMDDGLEGFMSAHLDREGKPVCRSAGPTNGVCKTLESAAMFAVGSARLKKSAIPSLEEYFQTVSGRSIVINGHTDSTGGEQANLELSLRRAMAVAEIAEKFGVLAEPRGYGEQVPISTNDTAAGRAANRRVELTCS